MAGCPELFTYIPVYIGTYKNHIWLKSAVPMPTRAGRSRLTNTIVYIKNIPTINYGFGAAAACKRTATCAMRAAWPWIICMKTS